MGDGAPGATGAAQVSAPRTEGWSWQWGGWASWRVSPLALVVAALAVCGDVVTAWLGRPDWHLGRILISPVLPLALLLAVLVGPGRLGCSRSALSAWREFLVVTGAVAVALGVAYARGIAGWREVGGVLLTAVGEEVVYRVGAVLLVGAACPRLAGRDWRDTASWGTGPLMGGLLGAAFVFSMLPGHVAQMAGFGTVVPFASLAILLGYASLRTGSILPAISTHVLLDLVALSYFAGSISATARLAAALAVLVGLALALLSAGRRLGLRRRLPAVIDLRVPETAEVGTGIDRRRPRQRTGLISGH